MAPTVSCSLSLLLVLALAVVLFDCSAADDGFPNRWRPIQDLKAPDVTSVGEFVVAETNNGTKTNLEFVSVVEGEKQPLGSGTVYRLVIAAKDGAGSSSSGKYEALVLDNPSEHARELLFFGPVKTPRKIL